MVDLNGDFWRDISIFLMSLKMSIDRPNRRRLTGRSDEVEAYTQALLSIEEARIRFDMLRRANSVESSALYEEARQEMMAFVDKFFLHARPEIDIYSSRFRINVTSRERVSLSPFLNHLDFSRPPIAAAVVEFREYVDSYGDKLYPVQQVLEFGTLERIIPKQQVAPAQFGVINGIVKVIHNPPKKFDVDRNNIASALGHILGKGEQLLESLEKSNCDRRLLESVKELQSQLTREANVVEIGLTNMGCGWMCSQFQNELPDAISAMVNAYNSSISMYVAQFPEWQQFTEKAAQVEMTDQDVRDIDAAAARLITSLKAQPELAEPEVPKTIEAVRRFLQSPGMSTKRAAYAMIKTIENLVSSILRHAMDAIEQTGKKTADAVSTVASRVLVGLLGLALLGAGGIEVAAVNAGVPWVKQAVDIVKKQIDKMSE